jgi:drug/metabolite transporter (DMT)-like permease
VIGLAVSGPVIGRFLYMKSLSLMPVSKAALILQFQPIWVAVIAGVLIGTIPSPKEWFGGALIIAGCILLVRRARGSRQADSPVAPEADPENPPDEIIL